MRHNIDRQFLAPVPLTCNAVFIGDSITNEISAGQYATLLASRYNWTILGRSDPIVNGTMEANITGWNVASNCTISQATDCPGISCITGAHALKMVATASGVATCNCGGDAGAFMRLNTAAGVPQTFGVSAWIPTGVTGNVFITAFDRIGSGTYTETDSALLNITTTPGQANNWQSIAALRTPPASTSEMFFRVKMDAATAGNAIWIDAAYIVHTNGIVLPAIGGAALATNAACGNANSILDNFTARVAAFSAPVYCLLAGTNDFFAMTDSAWVGAHGGPLYTPTQWGTAIRSAITQIRALSGSPQLYVFGMLPANSQVPNMGRLPSYATSGQDLRSQMDAQTRAACMENHVPFIPLWDMPTGFTDGIHPDASLLATGQQGHTWIDQRFQDVLNRVVR